MKRFGFQFNRIYLIESLPESEKADRDGELMSSGEYFNNILFKYHSRIAQGRRLDHSLIQCSTSGDLLSAINTVIQDACMHGVLPLIHFEVHGTEDETGVTLLNGEIVTWARIISELTKVNVACANNLMTIFSTCNGAKNLEHVKPINSAFPYYSVLAPDNIDYPVLMEERLTRFYLGVFSGEDFATVIQEVTAASKYATFRFSTCEQILYRAIQKVLFYLDIAKEGSAFPQTYISQTRMRDQPQMPTDRLIKHSRALLEKYKADYLLAGDPRNTDRFTMTVEELIDDGVRRFNLISSA